VSREVAVAFNFISERNVYQHRTRRVILPEYAYKLKLSQYAPRRRSGERHSSYSFLTSALDDSEWSASSPDRVLTPGKDPGTH
jgi:hypothetical protein